jgi:hypothetical protein
MGHVTVLGDEPTVVERRAVELRRRAFGAAPPIV